jgi:hypothetical protein
MLLLFALIMAVNAAGQWTLIQQFNETGCPSGTSYGAYGTYGATCSPMPCSMNATQTCSSDAPAIPGLIRTIFYADSACTQPNNVIYGQNNVCLALPGITPAQMGCFAGQFKFQTWLFGSCSGTAMSTTTGAAGTCVSTMDGTSYVIVTCP